MKAYVIEKCWYSDRRIIGVVETEEDAMEWIDYNTISCCGGEGMPIIMCRLI